MLKFVALFISATFALSANATQILCEGTYGSFMGTNDKVTLSADILSLTEITNVKITFKENGYEAKSTGTIKADTNYKPKKYIGYTRFHSYNEQMSYSILLPQNLLTSPKVVAVLQTSVDTGADNNDAGAAHLNCTVK